MHFLTQNETEQIQFHSCIDLWCKYTHNVVHKGSSVVTHSFYKTKNFCLWVGGLTTILFCEKCWCCIPHPACMSWLRCHDAVMKSMQTVPGSEVKTTAETNSQMLEYSIIMQHLNVTVHIQICRYYCILMILMLWLLFYHPVWKGSYNSRVAFICSC